MVTLRAVTHFSSNNNKFGKRKKVLTDISYDDGDTESQDMHTEKEKEDEHVSLAQIM